MYVITKKLAHALTAVLALCEGNHQWTSGFLSQRASNAVTACSKFHSDKILASDITQKPIFKKFWWEIWDTLVKQHNWSAYKIDLLTKPFLANRTFSFLLIWASILVSPRWISRACQSISRPNANDTALHRRNSYKTKLWKWKPIVVREVRNATVELGYHFSWKWTINFSEYVYAWATSIAQFFYVLD